MLRQVEEERREAARVTELREMMQQLNDIGKDRDERRAEDERNRQEAHEAARRERREEEDLRRERRDRLRERVEGLGVFKESSDLEWYLGKFERIMTECGV